MGTRVWGVSRIKDLRSCTRLFVSKYETKQWFDMPNESMERGSRLHKTLENSILYDLALDKELASVDQFVQSLLAMKARGASVVPEFKFGLDLAMERTEFFRAPGLRVRCALDVFVRDGNKLLTVDWKTGRYYPEHREEARFYGAATATAMKLPAATTMYVYIDNPQCTFAEDIYDPAAIMERSWTQFEKADHFLDSPSHSTGRLRVEDPPMQPGNHCGWCGDLTCPNNKNEKAKAMARAQSGTIQLQDVFK